MTNTNPYESPTVAGDAVESSVIRWWHIVGLCALLAIPSIFDVVYEPINRNWTVETFGCGCPPLDGYRWFNANDFNAVVWLVVFTTCTFTWSALCNTRTGRRPPDAFVVIPIGVIAAICLRYYLHGVWL